MANFICSYCQHVKGYVLLDCWSSAIRLDAVSLSLEIFAGNACSLISNLAFPCTKPEVCRVVQSLAHCHGSTVHPRLSFVQLQMRRRAVECVKERSFLAHSTFHIWNEGLISPGSPVSCIAHCGHLGQEAVHGHGCGAGTLTCKLKSPYTQCTAFISPYLYNILYLFQMVHWPLCGPNALNCPQSTWSLQAVW